MIKVAITGPEASGKSELTKSLAAHFRTSFASEFARDYLHQKDGKYGISDLDLIASGQIENEERAIIAANRICFFDTDMLVMHVWSEFRFGKVSPIIQKALENRVYDFWLLCKPDLPWTEDPLRESPDQKEREELFGIYYQYLLKNQRDRFGVVEGLGPKRFSNALSALDGLV